jgi:hypothetical protein
VFGGNLREFIDSQGQHCGLRIRGRDVVYIINPREEEKEEEETTPPAGHHHYENDERPPYTQNKAPMRHYDTANATSTTTAVAAPLRTDLRKLNQTSVAASNPLDIIVQCLQTQRNHCYSTSIANLIQYTHWNKIFSAHGSIVDFIKGFPNVFSISNGVVLLIQKPAQAQQHKKDVNREFANDDAAAACQAIIDVIRLKCPPTNKITIPEAVRALRWQYEMRFRALGPIGAFLRQFPHVFAVTNNSIILMNDII